MSSYNGGVLIMGFPCNGGVRMKGVSVSDIGVRKRQRFHRIVT